jgi:hypothetical protein
MEKKNYQSPEMKVVEVRTTHLINGTNPDQPGAPNSRAASSFDEG